MASKVSRELVVAVPVEKFFDLVVDYARYPEFVPAVKEARLLTTGSPRDVEYVLDLGVKKIRYTLRHVEERPNKVTWSLVEGEWMKVSNGSWELSDENGRTRARYTVEIQLAKPALVPQSLVDKVTDELTRVQLPKTLEAFKSRAEAASGVQV
jgi:ribosome-associated toxin RatA of RatAB toxin-antitoxin module